MAKVQHYRGLNTNLDSLYSNIKQEIKDQKDIQVVSEYIGTVNSVPLRSTVAVNKSPKVWAGSLREIYISITGGQTIMPLKWRLAHGLEALCGQVLWV